MNIGIDKLSFFVPPYYLEMDELARARGVDPDKFHLGLGQDRMAVNPSSQDIITLAANAASQILTDEDKASIDLVIVATESSMDESKAAAINLHKLLGIQPFARSIELKEACYSATAGLMMAKDHIAQHPQSKALLIAADIARYGLGSAGEPTQGAGAVALLITANPRILKIENESVALTQDVSDFFRPTGIPYPIVDGKLSNEIYIASFSTVWSEYKKRYSLDLKDFAAFVFHTPYTKMGKKALLPHLEKTTEETRLMAQLEKAVSYNRQVGNLYTGSLYLSLISLLENSDTLQAGDKLGLFSYGSGSVSEFFTGRLVEDYDKQLKKSSHRRLLADREPLSIAEYESMYAAAPFFDDKTAFSLKEIREGSRVYKEL